MASLVQVLEQIGAFPADCGYSKVLILPVQSHLCLVLSDDDFLLELCPHIKKQRLDAPGWEPLNIDRAQILKDVLLLYIAIQLYQRQLLDAFAFLDVLHVRVRLLILKA